MAAALIRDVYEENAKATGRKRYSDLGPDDSVGIRVTFDQCALDDSWLVPSRDAQVLIEIFTTRTELRVTQLMFSIAI